MTEAQVKALKALRAALVEAKSCGLLAALEEYCVDNNSPDDFVSGVEQASTDLSDGRIPSLPS